MSRRSPKRGASKANPPGGRGGAQGPSGKRRSTGSKQDGPKQGGPKQGGSKRNGPKQGGPRQGAPAQRQSRQQKSTRKRSGGAARRGLGGDQIEGRQAVRELLLAGRRRPREIYMIEDLTPADILEDIVQLASEENVPLKRVSRRHFEAEALTESHQGVLARAEALPEHDLDSLASAPGAFLLVLDGITDPGNLGAILRTAECAGVTGVVMPKHRSVHVSPTVTKTAAGAIEHLPMAVVGGIPAALTRLQELDVFTVGLEAGGSATIFDLPIESDTKVALVLGAEGSGLSRLVAERVDMNAAIPLEGRLNSLNVAMAGAVACFEVVRKRSVADPGGRT